MDLKNILLNYNYSVVIFVTFKGLKLVKFIY